MLEEYHGLLSQYGATAYGVAALVAIFLGYFGAPLYLWTVFVTGALITLGAPMVLCYLVFAVMVLFNLPPIRTMLVSSPIMKMMNAIGLMPVISQTERTALEAGTTWVDGELFSGKPNFERILKEQYPKLNAEEQAFLDGPVEELCRICDDWDISLRKDLPPEAWDLIKRERFLGLNIPKKYNGREFSALAQSAIVAKLSSRSVPLAISVMVPNSLGPGELLHHYGTPSQKEYYLPRLANGEEIPCFGLTEPNAGSDAGSVTSTGELFKGDDGKIYIRVSWQKRYITLAAISTIIGLAVKLRDPQNLLGKGEDLGITCLLVPTTTKGVVLGRRHIPMGVPFYNCPTDGHDVVISIDQVVGGVDGVGHGWRMLMECLAAGRAISLPAQSTGGAKLVARVVSAYAPIRRQFGVSIGKFEGIEEPLARIGGLTYLLEAARVYTCGAVDSGMKPSVISAIAKYNSTELGRKLINDGMDILGGAGISKGPRNLLANNYIAAPIGITVEGANILTRTLIIFGQGAIRCHPYAYKEVKALAANDATAFDGLFWKHIGFVVRNACRALVLSVTRGWFARSPVSGETATYYRKLAWTSASFAFMSDVAMGALGGDLKRREKLTGRYADILSWMYLGTATLRRFEAEGRNPEHLPFVHYAMKYSFSQIQQAFDGIYQNFEVPVLGALLRGPMSWWSRINSISRMPSDKIGAEIATKMQEPGKLRDNLTEGIYVPKDPQEALGRYEHAFQLIWDAQNVSHKIRKAVVAKKIAKGKSEAQVEAAVKADIITPDEAKLLKAAEEARFDAITVDSFEVGDFKTGNLDDNMKHETRSGQPTRLHASG